MSLNPPSPYIQFFLRLHTSLQKIGFKKASLRFFPAFSSCFSCILLKISQKIRVCIKKKHFNNSRFENLKKKILFVFFTFSSYFFPFFSKFRGKSGFASKTKISKILGSKIEEKNNFSSFFFSFSSSFSCFFFKISWKLRDLHKKGAQTFCFEKSKKKNSLRYPDFLFQKVLYSKAFSFSFTNLKKILEKIEIFRNLLPKKKLRSSP